MQLRDAVESKLKQSYIMHIICEYYVRIFAPMEQDQDLNQDLDEPFVLDSKYHTIQIKLPTIFFHSHTSDGSARERKCLLGKSPLTKDEVGWISDENPQRATTRKRSSYSD